MRTSCGLALLNEYSRVIAQPSTETGPGKTRAFNVGD